VLPSTLLNLPDHQSQQTKWHSISSRSPKLQQTRLSNIKYAMDATRHIKTLQQILVLRQSRQAVVSALGRMKLGSAPGYDLVHPEFLKHLSPKADLFTRMIWEQRIPKIWRQVKIIALAKPGTDPHLAASYPPTSLLSVCYKLLERIILQRISPTVEDLVSVNQAGFHHGCSTCDQVTALTTFIENGFEKTLKTGAVFLKLTAAHDTIWHVGLLCKLSKWCLLFWCVQTVELLL